ncbi:TfoX/Sxy family protein [Patescibacteria group bacterium]|nr:TfoX/Sxy family protein [Patescibacteria group bacterium]MDQ5919444.1 hypothetical protein [Patescibacteria group bacterium]
MATSRDYLAYIEQALSRIRGIRFTYMFGEYGVYYRAAMVGYLADNIFFLKATPSTDQALAGSEMGLPYPKAKPAYIISDALLQNDAYLETIIQECAQDILAKKAPAAE